MRTSLTEIALIESYLDGSMAGGARLLFEARLLLDGKLRQQVAWQRKAQRLVALYGRKKLKADIQAAGDHLFHSPDKAVFRARVESIFSKTQ